MTCATWKGAPGGAWPWCDNCGVRADLHDGSGPTGDAVRRIIRCGLREEAEADHGPGCDGPYNCVCESGPR